MDAASLQKTDIMDKGQYHHCTTKKRLDKQQHRGGHYNDVDEEVHHGHPGGARSAMEALTGLGRTARTLEGTQD